MLGGVSPPLQTGLPFQPSSGFGQQLVSQVNATGYGQMQPQPTGYPSQFQNSYQSGYAGGQQMQYPAQLSPTLQSGFGQQQLQPQLTSYQDIAQFDPYGPITQGWNGGQSQSSSSSSSTNPAATYNGHLHPREYIRQHKAELETWDTYSWKQILSEFDMLKEAWIARKNELDSRIAQVQRDYGYTGQQEVARLHGVRKDAESNAGMYFLHSGNRANYGPSDSVAASSYQMHEVFQGYRQSGDLASKRRVREATNAALTNLPDWPPQNY